VAVGAEPLLGLVSMKRVLVISPGVLPLPPAMGGAVENLISRLHPSASRYCEMEYISVALPSEHLQPEHLQRDRRLEGARIHYIDSINPLTDYSFDNQFELYDSRGWPAYIDFCARVAADRRPDIVHVHNEAHLLPELRRSAPHAKLLLHINDEVLTRMHVDELYEVATSCDRILACSKHISREIRRAFAAAGITSPPVEIFYNFVDLTEYDAESVSRAQAVSLLCDRLNLGGGPVVMFVGRMIEQKGPHLLLRAFLRVASSYPEAVLVFVGSPWYSRTNQSQFVTAMREEAAPLADRIRFTGYVDHSDMPRYYDAADIVSVPSIWDDPSPFVAYEAQAMGKPVIASTRGGIPEIVADRVTGRCIDVFNTSLFSDVLAQWIANPREAREIGKRGRRRMAERFELSGAAAQLRRVYDQLLAHT